MSKNNTINGTPGVKRIVPKQARPEPGLAVKVTGRNFAGVSYLLSLEAERRGVMIGAEAVFDTDGSLVHVCVSDSTQDDEEGYRPDTYLFPGDYVILAPESVEAMVASEREYKRYFEEIDA